MDTLKLKNAIKGYDGREITELSYDPEAIEIELYEKAMSGTSGEYQISVRLGRAAILAANPTMKWEDLRHIRGADVLAIGRIGAGFLVASAESMTESSDELSENTAESSM